MASPRTGSNKTRELVSVQTELVNVTIKRQATAATVACDADAHDASSINLACDTAFSLQVLGVELETDCRGVPPVAGVPFDTPTEPLFFEQSAYEIVIESRTGEKVTFWHENPSLREAVAPIGSNGCLLTGVLNFRNEIGYSDIVVRVAGRDHIRLTVEVFPTKIGYRDDYQALLADVTAEIYNLVFDFLKRTYQGYGQTDQKARSQVEFFAVIRTLYQEFIRSAKAILAHPHHELETVREIVPAHKARRVDAKGVRWLQSHPEHVALRDGKIAADRVLATRKQVSFDTQENRLVKQILVMTQRKLEAFGAAYREKAGSAADAAVLEQIGEMARGIEAIANEGLFREVGRFEATASMSLVFGMAPGYRELYRCHLLLQRGISIHGDVFNISVKDLAVLYEYWCFVKLNALMRDRYQLVSQDVVKVRGDGLSVQLVKGSNSRVRYRDPATGDEIVLSYNPMSSDSPTVTQRPDNVLSLVKTQVGGETHRYEYVFDAKYRLDTAASGTPYQRTYGTPGPKEEDINTMHRYRDAIVCASSQGDRGYRERTMFGAYVLFPYRDEDEYRGHKFFRSIEEVNIGGLPFLPSATGMVVDLIDELVGNSSQTAFDATPLPLGSGERMEAAGWGEKRDVLVGMVRSKGQLQACLEHGFYYVPFERVAKDAFPIRQIALYQPKREFGVDSGVLWHGEVSTCQVVRRCDIAEVPSSKEGLCYRFNVVEWRRLEHPVAIDGQGMRGSHEYTHEFLLLHASRFHELRLRDEAEWRLYQEVVRAAGGGVQASTPEDGATSFASGEFSVAVSGDEVVLMRDGEVVVNMPVGEFERHPRKLLGLMAKG